MGFPMAARARPQLSVIIPTIAGREDYLARCVESYERESPGAELIIVTDAPTCGRAWQIGAEKAEGLYLHFTADDITAQPMWWADAILVADQGGIPFCNVFDPNGRPLTCDCPLGEMGLTTNILVPFLSRKLYEQGGWLLPIHYGSDDWVAYLAVRRGVPLMGAPRYRVTHWVANEGRDYTRRHGDIFNLVSAMGQEGYIPPVYRTLEERLRTSVTGLDNVRIRDLDRLVATQLRDQAEARVG